MSHKVHPKIFRIKNLESWDVRGFYGRKLSEYLREDFEIREFLKRKLKGASIEKIEIERFPGKLNVIILSARPGIIIGRGGGGIEELKKGLEASLKRKSIFLPKKELKIEVREVRSPWFSANLSAQWIAQQIEKRVSYRRVLKQILGKIMVTKGILGARVEVAGRLDGSTIARREWLKKGQLPRQTIRADIDFARVEAHCSYGVIGVKVWIYKGEKFE
ncbi:MAG: 30S ribosomal protein S3 [Patescibacteria group bacterium]